METLEFSKQLASVGNLKLSSMQVISLTEELGHVYGTDAGIVAVASVNYSSVSPWCMFFTYISVKITD